MSVDRKTRRRFLKTAASALAMPAIIPATAIGKGGRPAPSERIEVGLLGYGTIAQATTPVFLVDERVQVVAVADPASELTHYGYAGELTGGHAVGKAFVEKHYAEAKPKGGFKGCTAYEDYRELLEKEDLNAVNISTPDHWHAQMCLDATAKGLHIYGQKPLALTVKQGRAMADAVAKAGTTWQTGSQQRSDVYFRTACEFVRNNRIGKVHTVNVYLPGGHKNWSKLGDKKAAAPVPEGLNYDLWQGPAPVRDYAPALLPLQWRHNYDYSGGMVTDFGAHHIDIVHWALGMDESGPVKLEKIQGKLPEVKELYNTATEFHFEAVYGNGTRVVVDNEVSSTGRIIFHGEDGKSITVTRDNLEMTPAALRREKIREDEVKLYESTNHVGNFIDCVYSGKPTVAPIEAAHRTITVAHLANIGIRTGKASFVWDPDKEKSTDEEVNHHLDRPAREAY
ncbi:MAG: Gfo/Idh/MocA family oxidoreductase [Verrucomicrobiota bacterium]